MNIILISVLSLVGVGCIIAIVLYYVSRKFLVVEDPNIDKVEELLPGANCGGCGFAGCRNFAENYVKTQGDENLYCTVGGDDVMGDIAAVLGKESVKGIPKVAVLRCSGTKEARPKTNEYNGVSSCSIAALTFGGDTGCTFGCVGLGDCVDVCQFGALSMNEKTGLPEVNEDTCTACGACVKACPKDLFELRNKGFKNRKVYVSCRNEDKGAVARKSCSNACIGCGKCESVCAFDAITIMNNLAYIDFNKCKLCRKCVDVCPTGAINAVNFPIKKAKPVEIVKE